MAESLVFTIQLPVYPERVYRAWTSAGEHSKFTGKPARVDAQPGGRFQSIGGEVHGEFKTLTPHDRIVQTWQMSGFPGESESLVELVLEPTCTGTELKIHHTGIPTGKSKEMLAWWEFNYLRPLARYFDELVGEYVADMGDG